MCGLVGVVGTPLPEPEVLRAMRDAMIHRGPDDAGLWIAGPAALAHRRLEVIAPGPAGRQPMLTADQRAGLVYNGEIYNHHDLRARMPDRSWRSGSDTETLLRWLTEGGDPAELRGMYALALVDLDARTLTLARDPLGIKPLFWARLPGRVLFASEIPALFKHPGLTPQPDPAGVSAYLTTLRSVLHDRTMFVGVRALTPGQVLTFDLDDPDRAPTERVIDVRPAAGELRDVVTDSVRAHLLADVPVCVLLSGGLDSTAVAAVAARVHPSLRSYCSGVDGPDTDARYARQAAATLGTDHREAFLDEATFTALWHDSVRRTGLPLSTPNETAIRLVARRLRADGCVVTLSGEGADELLAGYDGPMRAAAAYEADPRISPGRFQLEANAWMPVALKPDLLTPQFWAGLDGDAALLSTYERLFESVSAGARCPLDRHLRFLRRVNLVGLLQRLDSATMLESVEGRTPLADRLVAACTDGLRFAELFDPAGATPADRTKLALRRAFAGDVPESVLRRDKASFPVPFQAWMGTTVALLPAMVTLRAIVRPTVLHAIGADPAGMWSLAWPVLNLGLWLERWWPAAAPADGAESAQAVAASRRGTAESSSLVYSCLGA
jgi:asparagine synthase (glutamine-hydrolysing)